MCEMYRGNKLASPCYAILFEHICVCCHDVLCAARKSLSPVLDSSSSMVVKRRSPEEMEKELMGAEAAAELSLHPKDGMADAEGQSSPFS